MVLRNVMYDMMYSLGQRRGWGGGGRCRVWEWCGGEGAAGTCMSSEPKIAGENKKKNCAIRRSQRTLFKSTEYVMI